MENKTGGGLGGDSINNRVVDECREAFEKWCDKGIFDLNTLHDCPANGNPYDDWETNFAYQGWQAAWNIKTREIDDIIYKWHSECPV